MKKEGSSLKIILLVLLLAVGLVICLDDVITDIIWFDNMGYLSVFFTELMTKLKLGIPAFLIGTLVSVVLLGSIKRDYLKRSGMVIDDEEAKKSVRRLTWLMSAVFGVLSALLITDKLWFQILQYFNATDFGIADPLFNKDISFYMFKMDFLGGIASGAIAAIVAMCVMVALFYLLLMGFSSPGEEAQPGADGSYEYEADFEDEPRMGRSAMGDAVSGFFRAQNSNARKRREERRREQAELKVKLGALVHVAGNEVCILGVLLFLCIAADFYFRQFSMLYGGTGVAYGAGYTDINVTLNIYRAMMVLSVCAAIALVLAIKRRSFKLAILFPALMVIISVVGAFAATAVQDFIVAPDELNKESKYLQNNITFTRLAYNLQDIEVKDFTAEGSISKFDVLNNMETFSNIRINDFDPAEQFYNQTQSIRSYYSFNDVDVDRYYVNDEYTQVFLSAREIDAKRIEDSWLIKHLKYTHGYGITLSRVDRVTSSGQPAMLIDSIPPVSEVPEITIERPEIYYGELTDSYIITNTGESEFDYPSGESNVYCAYQGTGGIELTPLNRVLFALKARSMKMLISTNINSDSRIHVYRNIMTRVQKIAPFLVYDEDPCVVADGGRLYWIIDAYTQSENFPYSEPYENFYGINYVRNSVKVIVDAYNGDADFYICDESDPLIMTLDKIYPGLFKRMSAMPDSLQAHIQYPNELFNIQAYVYTKYHMTNVEVFYQSEDQWDISSEQYGQATKQMTPNYFIMKLPGESEAEFVSSIPYTPHGKSNMTGLLVARQDGDKYGKLVLYRMPKDRIIYGPAQIEAQINQDAEISKEFSLWNNSGSSYLRGNIFVIPVENSLFYVEPIYLEASTGSLPEVKRVVAFYGEDVAYEPTLAEALDSLFGKGAGDPLTTEYPIVTGHQMAEEMLNPTQPQQPETDEPDPGQSTEIPGIVETDDIMELAQNAYQAYSNAQKALESGNWADYGKYQDILEQYLKLMVE